VFSFTGQGVFGTMQAIDNMSLSLAWFGRCEAL
jgi:hypothetical protein